MNPKRPPLLPHERWIRAGIVGAVFFMVGLSAWLGPSNWPPRFPCGFRSLTGLPCLFCGGSRAAGAVMRGDFVGGFEWNSLAMVLFAGVGLTVIVLGGEALSGRRIFDWMGAGVFLRQWIAVLVLGLLLWWGFHVFRELVAEDARLIDAGNPVAGSMRRALRGGEL